MSADNSDSRKPEEREGREMPDDGGAEGFRNNCEYVKGFLNVIKNNQCSSMSENAKRDLEEMKEQMKAFLQEQEQGCKLKVKGTGSDKVELVNSVKGEVFNKVSMAGAVGRPGGDGAAYKVSPTGAMRQLSDDSSEQVSSESIISDDTDDRRSKVLKKVRTSRYQKSESERSSNSRRRRTKKVSSARVVNSSGDETEDSGRRSRGERKRSSQRRNLRRKSSADYRETPKLENFREETGQNIERYMMKFEDYCKQNFRGSKDLWLNILEEKLEGRMLETFKILRNPNDDYRTTIETFLKWYKDSADYRKRKYRKKFKNARQKKDESLFMFSIRLTSLFRTAYPRHDANKSKTLIKQFKQVISRNARESVNMQIMTCKLKNKPADWNFIQQCIRIRDLDEEIDLRSDSDSDSRKTKEVIINLGRPEPRNRDDRYGERRYSQGQDQGYNRASRDMSSSRVRNTNQNVNNTNRCFTCDKPGHMSNNCWRKLGLCLICGQDGHFVNECPNKRNNYSGRDFNRVDRQVRSRSYSRNNNYESRQNQGSNDYRRTRRASVSNDASYGRNTFQGRERFDFNNRNKNNPGGVSPNNNANFFPVGGTTSKSDQQVSLGQTTMNRNATEFHPRDRTSYDEGKWSTGNSSFGADKVSDNPRVTRQNLNY